MPITDLLWACPECGTQAVAARGRGAVCESCGARFERTGGAQIRREVEGRHPLTLSAAGWLDRLPPAESLLGTGRDPVREARVLVRLAEGQRAVHVGGRYVNHVEFFGERESGVLRLHEDRLVLETERTRMEWPLDAITTIQPSSRALQIRAKRSPLVSLEFPDDSIRLWEDLLAAALRRHYEEGGKGEIIEFQPRIVTR